MNETAEPNCFPKALLQRFCDAFDGYIFLIDKLLRPSTSLYEERFRGTVRKTSRLWAQSASSACCMLYAQEGVWAGADLGAVDPQLITEAVEPQPTGSSTGGFLDAELDALTPEEMQVVIEGNRLTDRQLAHSGVDGLGR